MSNWTTADIPDQIGRTAVIIGANTGLGFETAAALTALPTLRAATDPAARGGQYYGPTASAECVATRRWSTPVSSPPTRPWRVGYGQSPKN